MAGELRVPGSFRDPSGFLFFSRDGVLYRQVNRVYKPHYDALLSSGLYARLVGEGLLIPHEETDRPPARSDIAYKVLRPERLRFISYPYEWCFGQFKAAALATLTIQQRALEHGLTLKDASAYNIQFRRGRPLLIDTLSFESYREGEPWVAYRQFCQHFLAPLALMAFVDIRLGRLMRLYVDGVPLDLASRLLPWKTRFSSLQLHLHLHARAQARHAETRVKPTGSVSRLALLGLLDSLRGAVTKLTWSGGTEWGDYYAETSYSEAGARVKEQFVRDYLERAAPQTVWDLGANTGKYSRLAAERAFTVAFDVDPGAVERNYREMVEQKESDLLPLLLDLANPSPAIGWGNTERRSLIARGPADLVMALALLHHLAISNNVPFPAIAAFFWRLCTWLVIEFVPKEDPQAQRLLVTREDVFTEYTKEKFETAFGRYFEIVANSPIPDSGRVLYLMRATD